MKKKTFLGLMVVGLIVVFALGSFSAAVWAERGDTSRNNTTVSGQLDVRVSGDTSGASDSSSGIKADARLEAVDKSRSEDDWGDNQSAEEDQSEGTSSKDSNRSGSPESFKHRQDLENRQAQFGENDDGEIEIDQESAANFEATTTVVAFSEVKDRQTLRNFAAGALRQDDKIGNVRLSSTTVEAEYPTDARFLGFIPAALRATVSVTSDGAVNVSLPWYAFLFATSKDDLHRSVSKIAEASLSASTTNSTEMTLSSNEQATLLSGILSVLRGAFSGSR